VLIDLVDAGRANGEIDPSVDARLVAEALVGPLFYRRMLTAEPFPPGDVGAIVELILGEGNH
jgi:TetR/AcrR family transcriptional regulator of autoinduction and epiphytic fitness